jgi:glycosyltransferase involved in cell wall biosynthesis
VFVIPSFAEGMAQVGIEAMACALPIICTFNSGLDDLVEDGVNGFIIPSGDLQALKEKIQWFIDNRNRIGEMGNKARNSAKSYTWENYEKNVVKAISEMVNDTSEVE